MNPDDKLKLAQMRREIDVIDDRIVADLDRRVVMVKAIGDLKAKFQLKRYDPERERAVYARLLTVRTRLSPSALAAIYQTIHAAMIEATMERTGQWTVEDDMPSGFALKDGDRVLLFVGPDDQNRVRQLADIHNAHVQNAMVM